MKRLKAAKRALLGLNVCLAVGIVVFTTRFLVSPPRIDRLQDIRGIEATGSTPDADSRSADESVLTRLRNPVRPPASPARPAPLQGLALKGAIPALPPLQGIVFLHTSPRAADLTARTGEGILRDGKPAPEFREWRLDDVWKDRAVFANARGERCELRIESASSLSHTEDPGRAPRLGEPYRTDTFKSRLLPSAEGREVWAMDQAEIEWAVQNVSLILERDVVLSPTRGLGLRIEAVAAGSLCASRGLLAGDVLREVDGRPIQSLNDVRSLLNEAQSRPRPALRLTLDRAGKAFVLEFHPLPR